MLIVDMLKCRAFNWIERVEKSVICLLLDLSPLLGVMMIDIATGLLCLIPGLVTLEMILVYNFQILVDEHALFVYLHLYKYSICVG